jgi:hypothetical protein
MSSISNTTEMRELLVGTWTGVALLIDALVDAGAVQREAVIAPLSYAETLANDRRGVAISALRRLIAKQFDPSEVTYPATCSSRASAQKGADSARPAVTATCKEARRGR